MKSLRTCFALTLLVVLIHSNVGFAEAPSGTIVVTTAQRVHPVLLRKEHNALLRLRIDVSAKGPTKRMTAITFSLAGTDDVNDVESLSLFATGDSREVFFTRRVGEAQKGAREVTFETSYELRLGRHDFWLTCRLNPKASLTNRVDASCLSVRTESGDSFAARDETPGVSKRIGVALRQHYDNGVHTHRIAAIATTNDGTLLVAYDMRRRKSRDLQEDIDIGLSRSTDGGQTWEQPRVIMDMGTHGGLPEEQNGVSDPGLIVDQNTGEIFCSAVWMWGKPGKHQWHEDGSEPGYDIDKSGQYLMVRSTDDGRTWGPPENWTRKLKKPEWWLFAPSPQQGITLRDGTLVMPTDGRDENGDFFACIMHSSDHGKSWTVSKPAFKFGTENQAVELSDGSIMLNMRTSTDSGYRAVAVTKDLGETWSLHSTHMNTLMESRCNGSLYRFDYKEGGQSKSILLFANPQSKRSRINHTIQVSFDEGKTWPEKYRLLLDVGRGRGYPSITRVDDQHVGIVYEGSPADLTFEKISLDELLQRQ